MNKEDNIKMKKDDNIKRIIIYDGGNVNISPKVAKIAVISWLVFAFLMVVFAVLSWFFL